MSLYRRPGSPLWQSGHRHDGRWVLRRSTGTKDRRLAEKIDREVAVEALRLIHGVPEDEAEPAPPPLFTEAGRDWLATRTGVSDTTLKANAYYCELLGQEFPDTRVTEFKSSDLRRLQAKRRKAGLGPKRVNHELAVLQMILRSEEDWRDHVPPRVRPLKLPASPGKQLSREDEAKLLDAAKQSGSPALLALILTSVDTGLRASEIKSLRRRDLELVFDQGVIVSGQLVVPKSKTEAGTGRVVPFTSRVCAVLTLWLPRFPEASEDSYLFPRHAVTLTAAREPRIHGVELERPMGQWKTSWRRALRLAELQLRWHDLRHTFVSRLCESPNVSEPTIRALAGHVSQKMLDRYSHLRDEARRDAISVLEDGPLTQRRHTGVLQKPDAPPDTLH